jgi:CheY-like chemotaxis protein
MDWEIFEEIIHFILTNFYDYAALETNPQIYSVIKPPAVSGNRAEYVRKVIIEMIEKLKPGRKEMNPNSPEWRPYLVLQKRYVEGMGLNDLAAFLSISSRQLRRDHHRALEALTILLWNQFYPDHPREASQTEKESGDQMDFDVHRENLDPEEVLNGVFELVKKRFESKRVPVKFTLSPIPLQVVADRVVLRQILIGLFNEISHIAGLLEVMVKTVVTAKEVGFEFQARVKDQDDFEIKDEENNLDALSSWCSKIDVRLEDCSQMIGSQYLWRYFLWLRRIVQHTILVIDDQEPAINMFRRYLSQTDWKIIGSNRADHALALARQHQPEVITLDVMMPQVDGWELLQMLKLNEDTSHIPVIICSAWADPDMAISLGAAAYLKKPITQKIFLEAIEKVILV